MRWHRDAAGDLVRLISPKGPGLGFRWLLEGRHVIVLAALFALSIAGNAALAMLLVRAARRLLEFDEIWQRIMPVLFEYAEDLRKLLSLDLLTDNPEVVEFHRRNMRALRELDEVTKSVRAVAPPRGDQPLPRPDVE